MLVSTEFPQLDPELMYPGMNGLGKLGKLGDIPWSCLNFGLFCQDPITQTLQDNSNYGPALTQANRDLATSMAVSTIQADITSNPCNYSATNMTFLESLVKCGFDGTGNNGQISYTTILIALGIVGTFIILK